MPLALVQQAEKVLLPEGRLVAGKILRAEAAEGGCQSRGVDVFFPVGEAVPELVDFPYIVKAYAEGEQPPQPENTLKLSTRPQQRGKFFAKT